jgi:hypothetical protein
MILNLYILIFLHLFQPAIYWHLRMNKFKEQYCGVNISLHRMIGLFLGMDFIVFVILIAKGSVKCTPYLSNYLWCDLCVSVLAAFSCHVEFNQHNRREFLIADHIL